MDSVDYTKQLNRTNELFRKDLKDVKRSHEENLDSVKESAAYRAKKQAEAYDKSRAETEKNFKSSLSNLRSGQTEALRERNKEYEQSVNEHRDKFHNLSRENLQKWDKKFSNLKDSFTSDLEFQRNKVSENDTALRESFSKEREQIEKRHEKEKYDLLSNDLESKKRMRVHGSNEIDKIKENQANHYNTQRDLAASNFEKLSSKVNNQQEKFNEDVLQRVKEGAAKGIEDKNRVFGKRYKELDNRYTQDLRDIQRGIAAEKVSNNDNRKIFDERLRANEKMQHEQSRDTLLKQNVENADFYGNKISQIQEEQQDQLRQETIRNADLVAKVKEEKSLALQEKDFESATAQEKARHENAIRLNNQEAEHKIQRSRLDNNKNTKINNLKVNFREGLQKAHIATQASMNELKQESVVEKRELEKRLKEQNSDNTTQLKDMYNSKYEIMKGSLEEEILSLKNQNEAVQRSANEMVNNIRIQSQADLERQIASSERKLQDLLKAEQDNSKIKEQSLKKSLRETQAEFTRKMSEMTHSNQVKMKQLSSTLIAEAKKDVAAQRDENQIQKRYFTREIERLKSSSDEEKQALISQYENRIKQMQQAYAEQVSEIKNFNKLENA